MLCANYGWNFFYNVNNNSPQSVLLLIHSFIARCGITELTELIKDSISIPVPSLTEEWKDDLKKWPRITYSSIFSYFVDSVACDGKAMSNLKSSEAYQYLHNNKVGRVLFKDVGNDFVYLKADVDPSQSLNVSHHKAWVLVSTSVVIQMAGCSCSHAAAVMWKVSK